MADQIKVCDSDDQKINMFVLAKSFVFNRRPSKSKGRL